MHGKKVSLGSVAGSATLQSAMTGKQQTHLPSIIAVSIRCTKHMGCVVHVHRLMFHRANSLVKEKLKKINHVITISHHVSFAAVLGLLDGSSLSWAVASDVTTSDSVFFSAASSFLSAAISWSFWLSRSSRSDTSCLSCLIYSMALSTLAALELLEFCALVSGLFATGTVPGWGAGRRACISCRAMLMRFRRPCSAIL